MTGIVLDASATLPWCFGDELTPDGRTLLQRVGSSFAAVPAIWPLEVGNILAAAGRKGRITAADIVEFVSLLDGLDIRPDGSTAARGLEEILELARRESLSTYDAAYLDLAMREGLPLATRDEALADAARRCGVEVVAA